jgi:cleavage stimulation factor subunit 3
LESEELHEAVNFDRQKFYRQKQHYGLVYIAYLKFTLRTTGVEAFRSLFTKARKDKWVPWEVYEAAGILYHHFFIRLKLISILRQAVFEYRMNKQIEIAKKIFTVASTKYTGDVNFVLKHLSFLLSIDDERSTCLPFITILVHYSFVSLADAHVVFETAVAKFESTEALPIWNRWARHVNLFGTLEENLSLEKRIAMAFPGGQIHSQS